MALRPARPIVPLLLIAAVALAAPAFSGSGPTASSIPLAPFGDSLIGSSGQIVPLSPTSFLVGAEGADGQEHTADDVTLVYTKVDSVPEVTALPTPFLPDYTGSPVRVSATRAAVMSGGTDGVFGSADDSVLLLDQLGSQNTVTPIVVGAAISWNPNAPGDASSPVSLNADTLLVATRGPDSLINTADDTVAVISDLGGANSVSFLTAPRLTNGARTGACILSPTSFLMGSMGPDGLLRTADDQAYLFTDVGGANTRTDLATPFLLQYGGSRMVRVSATRAFTTSAGADQVEQTADDRLLLLDGLGSTNTVTHIPIPSIMPWGAGSATPLSDNLAAIATEGPDSNYLTADDQVAVISGVGTTNTVTLVTVGGISRNAASRPVRLSPTSCVLATGGPNNGFYNADDELVLIRNVGTTNDLTRLPLRGLDENTTSAVVHLGADQILCASGGANNTIDSGSDDEVVLLGGIFGVPLESRVSAAGELALSAAACRARILGGGRAAFISSGTDGTVGAGGDDLIRVIRGLPQPRFLQVKKAALNFKATQPLGNQSVSASGFLETDDPELFAGSDLVVSIGNLAQRIPASRVGRSNKGVFTYKDQKGLNGFIRSLSINPGKGKFSLSGKGAALGAETTDPGYVPVAIEVEDYYFSDSVVGSAVKKGISFKL